MGLEADALQRLAVAERAWRARASRSPPLPLAGALTPRNASGPPRAERKLAPVGDPLREMGEGFASGHGKFSWSEAGRAGSRHRLHDRRRVIRQASAWLPDNSTRDGSAPGARGARSDPLGGPLRRRPALFRGAGPSEPGLRRRADAADGPRPDRRRAAPPPAGSYDGGRISITAAFRTRHLPRGNGGVASVFEPVHLLAGEAGCSAAGCRRASIPRPEAPRSATGRGIGRALRRGGGGLGRERRRERRRPGRAGPSRARGRQWRGTATRLTVSEPGGDPRVARRRTARLPRPCASSSSATSSAGPGRAGLAAAMPELRERHSPDLVIANGENSAGGTGDHGEDRPGAVRDRRRRDHDRQPRLPPPGRLRVPGPIGSRDQARELHGRESRDAGHTVVSGRGPAARGRQPERVGAAQGRPIAVRRGGRRAVTRCDRRSGRGLVDFHAEVTSEKVAMGWHLDGRVAAVPRNPHPRSHRRRPRAAGRAPRSSATSG